MGVGEAPFQIRWALGLLLLVGVVAFLGIRAVNKSTQRSLDERVLTAQTVAQGVDHLLAEALLSINSHPGSGTRVTARLPLSP